jgi:predicted GNAT family acetyltransferase
VEIKNDVENHQYVAEIDGAIAGLAVYHLRGGRHIFVHTEVSDEFANAGVGSAIVRTALDEIRSQGGIVVPICPFFAGWIERHPEYDDIVDRALLDRINRSVTDENG